jgi:hypothetical protein
MSRFFAPSAMRMPTSRVRHEGDGNLGGDEDVAQPAASHGRRRGAGIYGRGERGAGAFERGGETEENASDEGDGENVDKDLGVGGDMQDQGAIFGRNDFCRHRHRQLEQGPGKEERDDAGDQAQQSALRQ